MARGEATSRSGEVGRLALFALPVWVAAMAITQASGEVALTRSIAGVEKSATSILTGLPAGWQGVLTAANDTDGAIIDVAGADHGRLLDVELRLDRVTPAATAVERGTDDVRALAAALARRGTGPVVEDTAQR